jgi:hypothetical protein
MTPAQIVSTLNMAGVRLFLDGDRLKVRAAGPDRYTPALRRLVDEHRAALIAFLGTLAAGVSALSPRDRLYLDVGPEGLVGKFGCPVSGTFLALVERYEAAQANGEHEKTRELEEAFSEMYESVDAVLLQATHLGADAATRHRRAELEVLRVRWRRGVRRCQMGFKTPQDEQTALATFAEILRQGSQLREWLDHKCPELLESVTLFEEDVLGEREGEANPLQAHLVAAGGWVGVLETRGEEVADRLIEQVNAWNRSQDPDARARCASLYWAIWGETGLNAA